MRGETNNNTTLFDSHFTHTRTDFDDYKRTSARTAAAPRLNRKSMAKHETVKYWRKICKIILLYYILN